MAQTGSQNTTPSPSNAHADMVDADEQAQRQKAIDTFLARTEFSKLARVLRARLSYASYKATHNIAHVPLTSLEHQLASRPTPDPAQSPTRKLTHTTSMPPPPSQPDNTRIWRSAGMSLYQAVLDPGPPTRRSRPQPHTNGLNGMPSTLPNGRERLAIPGRTVRNAPRRRHGHTLSTEREDITAATTLTAIMRAGATTPATLSRTSSASSVPSQLTPRADTSRTPQPDDAQAAELMLFLATSPSPARPSATRIRQQPSSLGLAPPTPARVLFPTSSDPAQLPTPESSQPTDSTPPQRPAGSFNLGDYINVSPSPGAFPRGESMVPIQGRRLFDDDAVRGVKR